MLLKYPKPEAEETEDEPDAEFELDQTPMVVQPKPRVRMMDAQKAGERMTALLKRGLGKRAIVVGKLAAAPTSPINWGVVLDVHPFMTMPLEIVFVSQPGARVFSDGTELDVIYRCMSENEMHEYLNPQHTQ